MFSFRVDKVGDAQQMNTLFSLFNDKFLCESYMICYEEKTKAGIPCKPHYHGIGKYTTTIKVESQRDKMKKYFSKAGYDKDKSQVHIIADDKEYNKALVYTLKQQNVFMTDFTKEEIEDLLEYTKSYQETIRDKLDTWSSHSERIMDEFKQKKVHYRREMLECIYDYIVAFNKTNPAVPMKRPCDATLKNFMINAELQLLPRKACLERWKLDLFSFLNSYETDKEDYQVEYVTGDEQFIDSDAEDIAEKNYKADDKEYQLYEP